MGDFFFIPIIIFLVLIVISGVFIVKQQTAAIVETLEDSAV